MKVIERWKLSSDESYPVMKAKIVEEVEKSDGLWRFACGDVYYLAGGWRKTKKMEFKQKTPFEIWYRPDLFSREGLNRKLSQEKQKKDVNEIWQKNKEKSFIQQSSECCPHRQT